MKLLLDTCAFLWAVSDPAALSARAPDALVDPENDAYLSSVSAWEIAVQYALGQLRLATVPSTYVPEQRSAHGFAALSLDEESALQVARLPHLHRDPFDRMLVCQAVVHGLTIVTPDDGIAQYAVRVLW